MKKVVVLFILSVLACASGQRITTIHLDGVQYFISRMNPYSPELNYFLAYQYCRSLGLQLASFETKEKAESVTTYLKNAGYGGYNFWTSGNRLGTTMFLWMSTGLPFNATFDFFENSEDIIQEGVLDPIDHNSNTSPQRTARDSGKEEKACVILQPPTLKWVPENCFAVKDFICEQTRCYYYNYGSIPVSSAQGRPIASTTLRSTVKKITLNSPPSTTPIPHTSFTKVFALPEKINSSIAPIKINEESGLEYIDGSEINDDSIVAAKSNEKDDLDFDSKAHLNEEPDLETEISSETSEDNSNVEDNSEESLGSQLRNNLEIFKDSHTVGSNDYDDSVKSITQDDIEKSTKSADVLPVEVRLKQISQEIEQIKGKENNVYYHNNDSSNNDDIGRQSFLSLTDLIRTLRPSEKHVIPQIDSDYSNAMRVLGDNSGIVNNNELRKLKNLHDIIQSPDSSELGL